MISQTAEYALRAAIFLAGVSGRLYSVAQIAETTQIPAGYLAKVMQQMCRAGVVLSQRGLHGGFRLARGPQFISVWEVVNSVDPIKRYPSCPLKLVRHRHSLCPLHQRLDDTAGQVEEAFRTTTLIELLPVRRRQRSKCDFPAPKSG